MREGDQDLDTRSSNNGEDDEDDDPCAMDEADLADLGADDTDDDPDYSDDEDDEELAGAAEGIMNPFDAESASDSSPDPDDIPFDDDEMESFQHDLKAAQGFKKPYKKSAAGNRGGGRRAIGDETYSFEVNNLMGAAHQAYVDGDLDAAMTAVKKVIQIEAGVYAAWKMLGEIFQEKGDSHKCLLAWLTAAHAKPKDWELWLICARMSLAQYGDETQGYRDQAIYCYNRALKANPGNIDAIYDRSLLLKETGQVKKALDGFVLLHQLLPTDMGTLKEMATLFIEIGKPTDATTFYEETVDKLLKHGNKDNIYGWSELNIMTELYMMDKNWKRAAETVSRIARWLCGRAEESFWDGVENDCEWDADNQRKSQVKGYKKNKFPATTYELPIELRVKLGICRLNLGQQQEAMIHFNFLKDKEPFNYVDLFQEVGDALFQNELSEDAMGFYLSVLQSNPPFVDRNLWMNMAACYKDLGQVEDAEDCYLAVLENNPKDADAMMNLAGIYEVSDRREEALELVNAVLEMKKTETETGAAGSKDKSVQLGTGSSMAFLPNSAAQKAKRKRRTSKLSAQQREEMERKRTEQTLVKLHKLGVLKPAMEEGNPEGIKEWLDVAGDLVDEFRNNKALYPTERGKGYYAYVSLAERRAKAKGEKENLERMASRLQESLSFQDTNPDRPEELTSFRGIDFDNWLEIFMEYAICLAKHDNYLDAYDVCSAAKEANVFYRDRHRLFIIWTTWLACAIWVEDSDSCATIARWFMTTYQFQTEVYSLFTAAISASRHGRAMFHNNAIQKYLLRQIKLMDETLTGKRRVGAASFTNLDENGQELEPCDIDVALLMMYGHILSCGKSYISALNYYSRVFAVSPKKPILLFSFALAYLHRSMQRQCENRALQVLQAFAFLFEYYDERTKEGGAEQRQEAEYNVARAMHHLGLTHIAVGYYERVIEISEGEAKERRSVKGDLRWEAAYNLQSIYVTSGNEVLAREVGERWLVV